MDEAEYDDEEYYDDDEEYYDEEEESYDDEEESYDDDDESYDEESYDEEPMDVNDLSYIPSAPDAGDTDGDNMYHEYMDYIGFHLMWVI